MGKRLLLAFLIVLNLFFLYRLFLSDQSLFAYFELSDKYDQLAGQIESAENTGLSLSREIRWLKSDKSYQEMIVRTRMNYLGGGEVLYMFSENRGAGVKRELENEKN